MQSEAPTLGWRLLQALAVLLLWLLGYSLVLALVLQQAGFLARPGDRLLLWLPAATETAIALETLADAGTVLQHRYGQRLYLVEVLDTAAAQQLQGQALALRVPAEPTLQSCLASMSASGR